MKIKNAVYLVVTADKFELPIFVCDNIAELSRLIGVKKETIFTRICRNVGKKFKILRVKI